MLCQAFWCFQNSDFDASDFDAPCTPIENEFEPKTKQKKQNRNKSCFDFVNFKD